MGSFFLFLLLFPFSFDADFKIFSNLEELYLGGNMFADFVTMEGMRGCKHACS